MADTQYGPSVFHRLDSHVLMSPTLQQASFVIVPWFLGFCVLGPTAELAFALLHSDEAGLAR